MTREKPKSDFKDPNIEREETRKRYLEKFREFATYLDDLPLKKLEPEDPNYYIYKCRNNFWITVSGRIQELLEKELIIDSNAIQKCCNFVDYCVENAGKTRSTTEEEIDYINEIISLVIEQLEKLEDKRRLKL